MNTDPITEAEIARVLELDALWGSNEATMSQSWAAENELALLCPRAVRELIAAREAMDKAGAVFVAMTLSRPSEWPKLLPDIREAERAINTQLNQP